MFLQYCAPSWKSFSPSCLSSWPFTDPFRASSNPLESLRGPPSRPLADPSRASSNAFVALRRSSCPFVEIFFPFVSFPSRTPFKSFLGVPLRTPFPTFGGSLSSLLQPLSGPSPFFVALRGNLFAFSPFVDIFFPLPNPWRTPIDPPTPSWPFAVLRGPSWISFCLFVEILSPLPDPWRIPLEPSPTP